MSPTKRRSLPQISRDGALVTVGLGLTINEAIFRHGQERPYLLMLFAGMMGLPIFLSSDEKKKQGGGPSLSNPTPPPQSPLPSPPTVVTPPQEDLPEQPEFTTPEEFIKWFQEQMHKKTQP